MSDHTLAGWQDEDDKPTRTSRMRATVLGTGGMAMAVAAAQVGAEPVLAAMSFNHHERAITARR